MKNPKVWNMRGQSLYFAKRIKNNNLKKSQYTIKMTIYLLYL